MRASGTRPGVAKPVALLLPPFGGSQSCASQDFESIQTEAAHVERPASDVPQDDDSDARPKIDVRGGTVTGHRTAMAVKDQVVATAQLEADAVSGWKFAGQRLNLNGEFWGKKSGDVPAAIAPPNRPDARRRIACATC